MANPVETVFNGKGARTIEALRAANIPVWWLCAYLLWQLVEQNTEMLRLIRALAAKSGVF